MKHKPCETCISYAICRTYMITALPKDYKTNKDEAKRTAFIAALAYYNKIETRCLDMCDFISKEVDAAGINNHQHDLIIQHIVFESLNL